MQVSNEATPLQFKRQKKKRKRKKEKKKKKICQLKILYPAKITFKDKSVSYQ